MKTAMRFLGLVLAFALAGISSGSFAQNYPNRPIKFVVAYSPGGGVDTMARIFAEQLSKRIGMSVVVENKPGGHGMIGAPDGRAG